MATTMNLCSKCYHDLHTGEEQAAKVKVVMEKSLSVNAKDEVFVEAIKPVEELPYEDSSSTAVEQQSDVVLTGDEKPVSKLSNRCFICRKNVGLNGFKYRCESTFCGEHRYPEKHRCSFDFKGTERDEIASENTFFNGFAFIFFPLQLFEGSIRV